jgi:hypothetical protein
MTTTAKAASNGSTDTATPPERLTGMARVEDAMAYHLASVANAAAYEAERLCNDIHRVTSGAYLSATKVPEASDTLASPASQQKINEALRCLEIVQQYLRFLMPRESEPLF